MIGFSMTPETRGQTGCDAVLGRGSQARQIVVRAAFLGACLVLVGCGQSMRDEHARVRGAVIEAKPGDGRLIASAVWTGENMASDESPSRVASAQKAENSSPE